MKMQPRSPHTSRPRRGLLVLLSVAFATATPAAVLGQDDETPQNLIGWFKYKGTHPIGKREAWALRADAEIKRNQLVVDPVSMKLRLGFERQSRVRLAMGYYFAWHSPYDAASQPYSFPEQGAWEEATFSHHLDWRRKTELNHRLRMEQQWLARRDSAGAPIDRWKFENVLAYRARLVLGEGIAAVISDEIWLRAPPRSGEKVLDQNRASAGVRFPLGHSSHWRFDIEYMHQAVFRSPRTVSGRERVNHNIRVTLSSTAPLR